MGEKDSFARNYLGNTMVFADVFNTLCYNGRPVIAPGHLEPMPVDYFERNLKGRQVTFSRDLLMRMTAMGYGNSTLVLLGLEHQSLVNYEMPLRCLHYDVLTLLQQCRNISRAHESAGDGPHFTGKLRSGEKLTPVITAVVYVGASPWDGPRTLREMLTDIPAELEQFIVDYRMLLLTPESISEDMFHMFKSDLGIALYYARLLMDKNKEMEFLKRVRPRLSRSAVEFLNASLATKIRIKQMEEEIDMCKAWEEQFEEGRMEGRDEGRREGREVGHMEVAMRLAEEFRSQKSGEELCTFLQKLTGISYEQALACVSAAN